MQNQNTIEHFHWGHFGAILMCAVFLIGVTFMRNGFRMFPVSASQGEQALTYEQIAQKVERENPELVALANQGTVVENSATRDQLALIDPTQNTGSVLGASTDETFPVMEYLSADTLRKIKVKSLGYTNTQAVEKYEKMLTNIDANYDTLALLGNFSTGTDEALQQNSKITPFVIAELTAIPVPTDVEEYHRLKIIYHTVLQGLADMKLGNVPDEQFNDLSNMLLGVMERMTIIRESVQNKYQITLP